MWSHAIQKLLVFPLIAAGLFNCCHPIQQKTIADTEHHSIIQIQTVEHYTKISSDPVSECHMQKQQVTQAVTTAKSGVDAPTPHCNPFLRNIFVVAPLQKLVTRIFLTAPPTNAKNTQAFLGVYRS